MSDLGIGEAVLDADLARSGRLIATARMVADACIQLRYPDVIAGEIHVGAYSILPHVPGQPHPPTDNLSGVNYLKSRGYSGGPAYAASHALIGLSSRGSFTRWLFHKPEWGLFTQPDPEHSVVDDLPPGAVTVTNPSKLLRAIDNRWFRFDTQRDQATLELIARPAREAEKASPISLSS